MASLTDFSRASVSGEISYIETEAAEEQHAEDLALLPEDEKDAISERTRLAAEKAMIEAAEAAQRDPFGVWLDYVLPPKDERRAADAELF